MSIRTNRTHPLGIASIQAGGGPFARAPGQCADAAAMAVALAGSLAERSGATSAT